MVDLPNSSNLTRKYLEAHSNVITIPYEIYDSISLPSVIPTTTEAQSPNECFFISNYCFTALDSPTMAKYAEALIKPCTHGFLVWQTIFGENIENTDSYLGKNTIKKTLEEPLTAPANIPNYFVYF